MDVRQCMIINNVAESAVESGLIAEDEESILSKQYDKVDSKRDNAPFALYFVPS